MLIGDYAEDYEAMVPFQMLLMVGHRRVALDTTDSFREVAHFKAAEVFRAGRNSSCACGTPIDECMCRTQG